jgi:large subunit ribosomal protein L29
MQTMELEKIRSLSDEELTHQEKTSAEQLFRIRFQMATDPSSGAKKLRELRKEIAQIKTVAKERVLGIRGAKQEVVVSVTPKPAAKKPAAKKAAAATTKPAAKKEVATAATKAAAKAKKGKS